MKYYPIIRNIIFIKQSFFNIKNFKSRIKIQGLIPVSLISVFLTSCATPMKVPPVSVLDLNRYSGVWYEVARYDHFFERGMDNVTATYIVNNDGSIKVLSMQLLQVELQKHG